MNEQNITKEATILIEIYKLFYHENPNFCDKDINIKMQSMMAILLQFGLPFSGGYGFHFLEEKRIPMSFNLQDDINNLYKMGKATDNKLIELSKDTKRIVKIVSDILFKEGVDSSDIVQLVTRVSQIIYAREYCLPTGINTEEIAQFLNLPVEEVENKLQLVKKIENKFSFLYNS
ncbi:MAG: hypothetical protein HFI87_04975 [Bacilli bacterium]|nr:hypothetical protein [Bacilli bacterium]